MLKQGALVIDFHAWFLDGTSKLRAFREYKFPWYTEEERNAVNHAFMMMERALFDMWALEEVAYTVRW